MKQLPTLGRTIFQLGESALLFAALVTPCFAGTVKTQVGDNIDFSAYRTYQWLPTKLLAKTGLIENDPEFTALVKEAVNREMAKLGLREVADGGDLQVATTAFSVSAPQVEAVVAMSTFDPTYAAQPVFTVGRYNKEGSLIVHLIDTRTKKTAWAGMVTEAVDNEIGSGGKKISKATSNLFKKYPKKKQ